MAENSSAEVTPLQRWERRTAIPMIVLSLLFLAAYVYPIVQPARSDAVAAACLSATTIIWAIFAAELAFRFYLSQSRKNFVRRHALDILIVALPMLRPLQLLTALRVLQRTAGERLRIQMLGYLSITTAIMLFVAAVAALSAERGQPGSQIENLPDALWWALVTVTTVGYGDMTPVTASGRMIAVLLMVGGISIVGTITAAMASWIMDRIAAGQIEEKPASAQDIAQLRAEIAELKELIQAKQ